MLHVRDCSGSMTVPKINHSAQQGNVLKNTPTDSEERQEQNVPTDDTIKAAMAGNENSSLCNVVIPSDDPQPQSRIVTATSAREKISENHIKEPINTAGVVEEDSDVDSSLCPPASCLAAAATSITIPCPFPWCRPVKHVLHHLLFCKAGRNCRICFPRAISDNLATLSSLNAHRTNAKKKNWKDEDDTANDASANLDDAKAEMMACVESMLAAAEESNTEMNGGESALHPGDPSLLTNEELLMKTSESFLLPHTFPDDMMRLESSASLSAQVAKEETGSSNNIHNVTNILSTYNHPRDHFFSSPEVYSCEGAERNSDTNRFSFGNLEQLSALQPAPCSSCNSDMLYNLGDNSSMPLIKVETDDGVG